MDYYKKIFRNKHLRFIILSVLNVFPDKFLVESEYRIKTGRKLNLESPERYTEKLQYYKLYYRDPKMVQCVDKYRVRDYVAEKGLENILNEQYAVFESADEISFDGLPDRFVLKLSNGSNTNLFFENKNSYTIEETKKQFKRFLVQSRSNAGCEWVYNECTPVIIAEKYMKDPLYPDESIPDYKFLCFDGRPEYVIVDRGRFSDHRRNIYDTSWKDLHIVSDCKAIETEHPKPEQLPQMLEIAAKLSEGFPAARIDLYIVEGKIYFGEITFFPWSGYVVFDPDEFDFELGKRFVLPENRQSKAPEDS